MMTLDQEFAVEIKVKIFITPRLRRDDAGFLGENGIEKGE